MLHRKKIHGIAAAFVLVALGFLVGFWPLSVAGILLAALMGRWAAAVLLGLLLDIAYGTPVGRLHFLYLPFTLLALLGVLARQLKLHYFRRPPVDHL
jgi:hypothetical protein